MLKQTSCSRKFHNPKNVISFRGSVVMCHSPLQLGFLFEDGGSVTLADLIFGIDWELPSTQSELSSAMGTVDQMLDGLDFLHENAVVHGRLAPDTILVCFFESDMHGHKITFCSLQLTKLIGGTVKLSEPSTSLPVVDELTDLTPYLAPEVLSRQRGRRSADIYSIGVILWEMLSGRRAYLKEDLDSLGISDFVRQVTGGTFHPGMSLATEAPHAETATTPIAASWNALAHKCWSSIERERPSLSEVRQALQAVREQSARRRSKTFEEQLTGMLVVLVSTTYVPHLTSFFCRW